MKNSLHFEELSFILFMQHQLEMSSTNYCKFEVSCLSKNSEIVVSSTYFHLWFINLTKSLTMIGNNIGPRTVHCATPPLTFSLLDWASGSLTLCVRLDRKLCTYLRNVISIFISIIFFIIIFIYPSKLYWNPGKTLVRNWIYLQTAAGADPAPELNDAYIRSRICREVRGYPPPGNFEI
jgi:hypothetical protein